MSQSLRFLQFSLLFFLIAVFSTSAHTGHSDYAESKGNHKLHSRTLILAKIWCMIIVFVVTFVAGVLPYLLKFYEGFLVLGTQFAGGVFLGIAMMHFLIDAHQTFEDLTQKKYPFAFMLACVGYVVTMSAESVIYSVSVKKNMKSGYGGDVELQGDEMGKGSGTSVTPRHLRQIHISATSLGDTILMILALCLHSLYEGIAIGVVDKKEDAWRALWRVSLHKIVADVAMGIALLRKTPNHPLLSCAIYAFAFAISSPVGVAIGMITDSTKQGALAGWIFAISMGLVCGSFIYVSVNHLLSEGYVSKKPVQADTLYFKFLAVLLGIGIIAIVMVWDV